MARYKTIDLSPRFLAVDLDNFCLAVLPTPSITCLIATLTYPALLRVIGMTGAAPSCWTDSRGAGITSRVVLFSVVLRICCISDAVLKKMQQALR